MMQACHSFKLKTNMSISLMSQFMNLVSTYPDGILPCFRLTYPGHALTYHEENWVEQGNTGTFWEPIAEWFADTYMTSDFCAAARARGNQTTANQIGTTLIDFRIIIDPQQVIIDGTPDVGNYYEQWPLFTYMTNNPDNIEGLGKHSSPHV